MKVIIPAAGEGRRMQPLTYFMPKPLLYVGRKRMIDYVIDSLAGLKIDRMILVTGYKGGMIEEYLKSKYMYELSFVEQREQHGLGDAVLKALDDVDDELVVLLSDTIVAADIEKLASSSNNVIAVSKVDDPHRFGIVEMKGGIIKNMVEKPADPPSNLAITGLYYFRSSLSLKKALENISRSGLKTKGEVQLTDAMKLMMDGGEIFEGAECGGWTDCGNHEMLLQANAELLEKDNLENHADGQSVIKKSQITNHSSLFGNAKIENSVIENSIIMPGAVIENCRLTDSIVGEDSLLNGFEGRIICGNGTIIKKAN